MSKFQKPALYQGKALDQQWINNIFNSHDLFCGCNHVIDHLKSILADPTWPGTGETSTAKEDTGPTDETGLSPGDLERLFAEDDDGTG